MQTPFDPKAFYGQPRQTNKSIIKLLFWFTAGTAFGFLIYFSLDLLRLDWDIEKYVYLTTQLFDIGIWIIPFIICTRISNKTFKVWGMILSIFLLVMNLYWFITLIIDTFFISIDF